MNSQNLVKYSSKMYTTSVLKRYIKLKQKCFIF